MTKLNKIQKADEDIIYNLRPLFKQEINTLNNDEIYDLRPIFNQEINTLNNNDEIYDLRSIFNQIEIHTLNNFSEFFNAVKTYQAIKRLYSFTFTSLGYKWQAIQNTLTPIKNFIEENKDNIISQTWLSNCIKNISKEESISHQQSLASQPRLKNKDLSMQDIDKMLDLVNKYNTNSYEQNSNFYDILYDIFTQDSYPTEE